MHAASGDNLLVYSLPDEESVEAMAGDVLVYETLSLLHLKATISAISSDTHQLHSSCLINYQKITRSI